MIITKKMVKIGSVLDALIFLGILGFITGFNIRLLILSTIAFLGGMLIIILRNILLKRVESNKDIHKIYTEWLDKNNHAECYDCDIHDECLKQN
jgi:uncharacterized membrane protein